jgi:hypothetical protein
VPLNRDELIEHAGRMRELLKAKQNLVRHNEMGPVTRAHLVVQVSALSARVDQILRQCEAMVSGCDASAVLEGTGMRPGVHHFAHVVSQA